MEKESLDMIKAFEKILLFAKIWLASRYLSSLVKSAEMPASKTFRIGPYRQIMCQAMSLCSFFTYSVLEFDAAKKNRIETHELYSLHAIRHNIKNTAVGGVITLNVVWGNNWVVLPR